MFTLLHNTIVYLYKEGIDMRLGMFRLQRGHCPAIEPAHGKACFFLFINKPSARFKAVWYDGTGLSSSASDLKKVNSAGHNLLQSVMKNEVHTQR